MKPRVPLISSPAAGKSPASSSAIVSPMSSGGVSLPACTMGSMPV
jgi:hypothetical protein